MERMNRVLGNQVDESVFTLGDEDEDEDDGSLRQQPEAISMSAADVRLNEDREQYKGELAGATSESGLTQVSPGEPGKGMGTVKPKGAEVQPIGHTISPHEPPVAKKYSGLNGRSEAAPAESKEGVAQPDGQPGAGPSSQRPMPQSVADNLETTNAGDNKKAAPPPIAQQLGGVAANSKKGPSAPERNPESDNQTSAAINTILPAEPESAQAVSPDAEEQRIADVRFHSKS